MLVLIAALPSLAAVEEEEETAAIEKRIADSARYLASDELEGRGIGSKGIDLAADHIARQFQQAGLKTDLFDGTSMQQFSVTTSAQIGSDNKLALLGPAGNNGDKRESIVLEPGKDFSPMAASGSGSFDLPLVFAGYGITGQAEKYDDYAGIDVEGKAVVILRHEPQQADPKSVFDGTKNSDHAPFLRKVSNAYEHGAAAVIFCTDNFEIRKEAAGVHKQWQQALDKLTAEHAKFKKIGNPTLQQIETQRTQIDKLTRRVDTLNKQLAAKCDPVMPFRAARGAGSARDFPIVHCRRAALDRVVRAALGSDLAKLEEQIDDGPTPHSAALTGWRIAGQTDVNRKEANIKNVVAVLEGEGPLAEETIVLGAHYDHVGYGGHGSREPNSQESKPRPIHNGADDNASGVAVLIEVARTLAARPEKLGRRVVFIAFSGEERGLLGSAHYVNHPLTPLENTVAMLNLDMVGRLRDDKLTVMGTGTAKQFDVLLEELCGEHGFELTKKPGGFGPSDQASFYAKKIPVMHFITGFHTDVHRPSDDFEKLNVPGMRRVARLVEEVTVTLANAEDRPEYVFTGNQRTRPTGNRPYLGTVPDFAAEGAGYVLSGVVQGGPAEQAGIRGGDSIVRLADSKIGGLEDIDSALRKHKAGDRVQVVVLRDKQQMTFEVTLGKPQ